MKTKTLILLAVTAVLLSSCYRERRYYLTEAQMQTIPYERGQVISFIFGTGQAVDLTVTERRRWFRRTGTREGDNVSVEIKGVVLRSELNCLVIDIELWYGGMRIEVIDSDRRRTGFLVFMDGEGNFLNSGWNTSGTNSIYFHENLEINNRHYFDVAEINRMTPTQAEFGVPGTPRIPIQLFYNKTYGILQINRDGENFLTINH